MEGSAGMQVLLEALGGTLESLGLLTGAFFVGVVIGLVRAYRRSRAGEHVVPRDAWGIAGWAALAVGYVFAYQLGVAHQRAETQDTLVRVESRLSGFAEVVGQLSRECSRPALALDEYEARASDLIEQIGDYLVAEGRDSDARRVVSGSVPPGTIRIRNSSPCSGDTAFNLNRVETELNGIIDRLNTTP
jgi:hypothetical protein